jgi:hypothetical protein
VQTVESVDDMSVTHLEMCPKSLIVVDRGTDTGRSKQAHSHCRAQEEGMQCSLDNSVTFTAYVGKI